MTRSFLRTASQLAALAIVGVGLAGCGTIFSQQYYGSPAVQLLPADATKAEVLANYGAPNSVYKADNGEAFFYKYAKGRNVLGIYSQVSRTDTVVVFDGQGNVVYTGQIPVGEGFTIISPPMLNATHPIPVQELLFDPENYEYRYELSED